MAIYRWVNMERIRSLRRKAKMDGVQIEVEISPYHTPQGVTGAYSAERKTFSITFDYIDDEPGKPAQEEDGVWFVEGQFTGKILSIELPTHELEKEGASLIELKTRVKRALKTRLADLKLNQRLDQELNQEAAEEVIDQNLGELVDAQ